MKSDPVNHPAHYNAHPHGIECIALVERLPFCQGNAIKYLWRAGLKGGAGSKAQDLAKALWYVERAWRSGFTFDLSALDNDRELLKRACAGFATEIADIIFAIAIGEFWWAQPRLKVLVRGGVSLVSTAVRADALTPGGRTAE